MKKWIKLTLAALFLIPLSLFALLFVLYVAINWQDEELRPEVQALLNWKAPEHALDDDNGYLIALGMGAPAGQDAATVGKTRLEGELARYEADLRGEEVSMPSVTHSTVIFKDILCYDANGNCVDFYLNKKHPSEIKPLQEFRYLTDRLHAIQQSKNYIEVWPPYIWHDTPNFSTLIIAAKLEHWQIALDIEHGKYHTGIERLIANARFSRRMLKESHSVLTHSIALALVKFDVRFLSELLVKYPRLAQYHAQLAPIAAPLSSPEFSLSKAMDGERSLSLPGLHRSYSRNKASNKSAQDESSMLDKAINWILEPGYKLKATTNLNYDLWETRIKVSAAKANELEEERQRMDVEKKRLMGWGYSLYHPYNFVGKILLQVAEPAYISYPYKHHDTDGYVRLVALQLKLMADMVSASRIPEAINAAEPEYRDPYTLQPMQWDAEHSELSFEGRYNSHNDASKSNKYHVTVPIQKS